MAGNRLGRGAISIFEEAIRLAQKYSTAKVVFGSFSRSASVEKDRKIKEDFLLSRGIDPRRIVYVGSVSSTLTEAEDTKRFLESNKIPHCTILLVTGACHSRTCYFVWKKLFPALSIQIYAFGIEQETDPEDRVTFQRSPIKWLLANIARHMLFLFVYLFSGLKGIKALRRLTQPTA
ncbi:MAG: hypothetical protein K0S38_326 [Candidatus Paceibacter sp.]|nr:hypothetical protein [Candidatus Paceibacter sp.]